MARQPALEVEVWGYSVGLLVLGRWQRHCVQRTARGQFRYVHIWQDHLFVISAIEDGLTLGLALESGQIRRLTLLSVLVGSGSGLLL